MLQTRTNFKLKLLYLIFTVLDKLWFDTLFEIIKLKRMYIFT